MNRCDFLKLLNQLSLLVGVAGAAIVFVGGLPFTISVLIGIAGALVVDHLTDGIDPPDLSDCDPTHASPLVLDLDGNGVEAGALAHIDHEGDGWAEVSRWADEGDGILVWDRNGDGVINDGSELFGDNTVLANGKNAEHGFAALSELDSNGDGIVNAVDENFSDLRVMRWADVNENGTKSLFFNVKWRA